MCAVCRLMTVKRLGPTPAWSRKYEYKNFVKVIHFMIQDSREVNFLFCSVLQPQCRLHWGSPHSH
jgi:hypothetical protein